MIKADIVNRVAELSSVPRGKAVQAVDTIFDSMKSALAETERRRALQAAYNAEYGITPESIRTSIRELLQSVSERDYYTVEVEPAPVETFTSPEALEIDHKAVRLLTAIGLPSACMLHGYVGFIFGGIKANPWWSTPLMPIIFLLSAAVSGIALLILLYQVTCKLARRVVERETVQSMVRWLWFFLIITVTLELLEIIMLAYENSEEWHIISQLLTTRLQFSFISMQMIIGSLIPFILLFIVVTMNRFLHDRVRNTLAFIASLLLLVQVFSMRWNVVIGGQLLSKSFRGLRSAYEPHLFEREGILMAIVLFVLPFALLYVFDRLLPIEAPPGAHAPEEAPPEPGVSPGAA